MNLTILNLSNEVFKMDNIVFEKLWQDEELLEFKVVAHNEFIEVLQSCYIATDDLKRNAGKIIEYKNNYELECYLEFGKKEGNYTPAFSMLILPADSHGHLKIELDIEIADNEKRCHRCSFYIKTEIGMLDKLGNKLAKFEKLDIGGRISLIEIE